MSVPRYSAPARGSLALAWGIKKNQNRNCSEPSPNYEPDQELFEREVQKCLNVPVVSDAYIT
jgi:hypothetical protein